MANEAKSSKPSVSPDLWTKCKKCEQIVYNRELEEALNVCPKCGTNLPIPARERMKLLLDEGTESELDSGMVPGDPLNFLDGKTYKEKAIKSQEKTKLGDAVWTGTGKIKELPVVLAVMEFHFLGGSMGSVVGEKLTRAGEHALEHERPFIIVSTSGGARMHEGIFSLMQMAKVSSILARLKEKSLPYISVLSDPTTGGVTASYAMLGDFNFAEPGALIGFAGPRVIEQTIRQTLPEGFQRSEFLLKHGMVDRIISRADLKNELFRTLKFLEKNFSTQSH